MNDKIKVSVIMPVYNSEKYLSNAIDSILNQSLKEIELILVDDGSKDSSGSICDKYAKEDDRVIVIHKSNGGICSARNVALNIARGDYIAFCDNDDEFLPGLLEDNYTIAADNDIDLMRFSCIHNMIDDEGRSFKVEVVVEDGIIDLADNYDYEKIRCSNGVWDALYKFDIIKDHSIKFNENIKFGNEDLFFNLQVIPYCKKFGFNSHMYYMWNIRSAHSTTMKFSYNYFLTKRLCLKKEGQYINSMGNKVKLLSRVKCFTEEYIYPTCKHLNYSDARVPFRVKRKILEKFQGQRIISRKEFFKHFGTIIKGNKKQFVLLLLFLMKQYWILLTLLKISDRIFYNKRYK